MLTGAGAPGCAHTSGRRAPCTSALAVASRAARRAVSRVGIPGVAAMASSESSGKVLLIGMTGVTGRCALEGLIAGGLQPGQLVALTRSPQGAAARGVAERGVQVAAADLDDPASLRPLLQSCPRVYLHALSGDAASADPQEVRRGAALAALLAEAGASHVVYNGAAGRGADAGVSQMEQKHQVGDLLLAAGAGGSGGGGSGSGMAATVLETTMFMEELWKRYTRPQILKGSFPFSIPSDKLLQFVSARDLGLAAAVCLQQRERFAGRAIPLAANALTPAQLCAAFSAAQGGAPVKHSRPPAWLFWVLNRDLWRIVRFLSTTGYQADVAACRADFPGMLTFAQFLAATGWGDAARTYEQGIRFDRLDAAPVAAPSVVESA